MKRLLLIALLAVGCQAAPTSTPDTRTSYVVDFAVTQRNLGVFITVKCAQRPTSVQSARALCDLEHPAAHVVTPEEWERYNMGDPYPAINP